MLVGAYCLFVCLSLARDVIAFAFSGWWLYLVVFCVLLFAVVVLVGCCLLLFGNVVACG